MYNLNYYHTCNRCVKINAFLKQHMGFEDVNSLKKGIINYENWIIGSDYGGSNTSSLFRGKNFIFDRRRINESEKEEKEMHSP